MLRRSAVLAVLILCACGGSPAPRAPAAAASGAAIVDPAALYCAGVGGQVVARSIGGRRADLCRLPDGRTVTAASLINSHNDL